MVSTINAKFFEIFVFNPHPHHTHTSITPTPTPTSGRYQSGQMGQTVNLLAKPSEVRILLSPHPLPTLTPPPPPTPPPTLTPTPTHTHTHSHTTPTLQSHPHPHPLRGSSSFGRAEAFQASGGGFEPRLPLTKTQLPTGSQAQTLFAHTPLSHPHSHSNTHPLRLCSSGVEHFLGKEGVTSSILVKGSRLLIEYFM